jgi:large subunit ribosomal protein L25
MSDRKTYLIEASPRERLGRGVRTLRSSGQIPAVLYGHGVASQHLQIPSTDFEKVFKEAGESTIVKLQVDGSEPVNVLIQDVQRDNVLDKIVHVDFYQVKMTEKLKAHVPIKFVGESPAVKALGGTLVHNISEVEVESLPGDLPHEIEVDVSILNTFDDDIRVKDLKVDRSRVKILVEDEDLMVAMVQRPRTEEELKELEQAPVEADVSKVEGIEKPEEPAEGEAAAEPEKKTEEKK